MKTEVRTDEPGPGRRFGLSLVLWLSMAQLVSWGSIYYGFSLFIEPMGSELGWTAQQTTGAFSLSLLVAALCAIPVGRAVDHGHARVVMTGGSLLATLLLLAWSLTENLIVFYAIWTAFGVVLAAVLYEPAFAVLVRNYPGRQRSAIALMTLIGGFASTLFVPLTYWLIESLGWREALRVLAMLNVVICVLIHWLVLPAGDDGVMVSQDLPEVVTRLNAGKPAQSSVFWWLAVSFSGNAFVFSAISAHLMPLLQERSDNPALILLTAAIIGPAQVLARLLALAAERHASVRSLGLLAAVLLPVSMTMLYAGKSSGLFLLVFALLYGISNGLMTLVRGGVVLEYFGPAAYGALTGGMMVPAAIAKAVAPLAVSLLWAQSEGYDLAVWFLAICALLSGLAFRFARPPRRFGHMPVIYSEANL